MTIFLLLSGSVLLITNYIYSSIFSRTSIDEELIHQTSKNLRYIYTQSKTMLYADFEVQDSIAPITVFYLGYGADFESVNKLKSFYQNLGFGTITIYANGYYKSGGKKKQTDEQLKNDLLLWLDFLIEMFGENCKIILHGFHSTALSCFLSADKSDNIKAVVIDSARIFPIHLYKDIKNPLLRFIFKNKSRVQIPEINTSALIISDKNLAKDSYKLYELSQNQRSLYVYEKYNIYEYIITLKRFLFKHIKLPEESA